MKYLNLVVHIIFSFVMGIYTLINGLMSLGTPAFDSLDSAIGILFMILFMGSLSVFSLVCGIISFVRAGKMRTGTYITLESINHGAAILLLAYWIINKIVSWFDYLERFPHPVARSAPDLSIELFFIAVGIACIVITAVNAKKLKAKKTGEVPG